MLVKDSTYKGLEVEVISDGEIITEIKFEVNRQLLKQNLDGKDWAKLYDGQDRHGQHLRHIAGIAMLQDWLRCQYIGMKLSDFADNEKKKSNALGWIPKDPEKLPKIANPQDIVANIAKRIAGNLLSLAFKDSDNVFFGAKENNEATGELYRKLKPYVVKGKNNFKGCTIGLAEKKQEILSLINSVKYMHAFAKFFSVPEYIKIRQDQWDELYDFFKHVAIDYEAPLQARKEHRGANEVTDHEGKIKRVEQKFQQVYNQCSSPDYVYDEKKFYGRTGTSQAIITALNHQTITTTTSSQRLVSEHASTSLNKKDTENKHKKRKTEEVEITSVNKKQPNKTDVLFEDKKQDGAIDDESYETKKRKSPTVATTALTSQSKEKKSNISSKTNSTVKTDNIKPRRSMTFTLGLHAKKPTAVKSTKNNQEDPSNLSTSKF